MTCGHTGYGVSSTSSSRVFRRFNRDNGSYNTKVNEFHLNILRSRSNVPKLFHQGGTHGPTIFRLFAHPRLTNLNHPNLPNNNNLQRNHLTTNTIYRRTHRRATRHLHHLFQSSQLHLPINRHFRQLPNHLIRHIPRGRQRPPNTNSRHIRRPNRLRQHYRRLPLPRTRVYVNPKQNRNFHH